jgi:8-oxo-dGTP diphosphatase
MIRSYPDRPVVGVGAVVLDGERVLLVKRGREPLLGVWTLPGGAVELGETMREAVARELREETGLAVEVGPIVETLEQIRADRTGRVEYHYVLVDFLCRATGGEPSAASDAADVDWVPLDRLADRGVPGATIRVVRKARSLL